MSEHSSGERLRSLPPYLFDLLSDEEASQLREALESDASAQTALRRLKDRLSRWDPGQHPSPEELADLAARDPRDATGHVLGCRDCAFELAILQAARSESDNTASTPPTPARGFRTWMRAAALVVVGGGLFVAGRVLGPDQADPVSSGVPLRLESTRSAGDVRVPFSTLRGRALTLWIQVPVSSGDASWELRLGPGSLDQMRRIAGGALSFEGGPRLREVALWVSPDHPWEAGRYTLVVRGADGEAIRTWDFGVSD